MVVRPLGECRLGSTASTVWRDTEVCARQLATDSPTLAQQGFVTSYETFEGGLAEVPRLYIEPDGSFCWVSPLDPERRISGQITDDGTRVLYLELRGRCLWEDLEPIVRMLGWPQTRLVFQLMPESLLIEEPEFRKVICGDLGEERS